MPAVLLVQVNLHIYMWFIKILRDLFHGINEAAKLNLVRGRQEVRPWEWVGNMFDVI